MEFVEGEPITTWCDRRGLSVRRRLELFRQVCDAVRHAHQNLVVHRDLKPGNILVTSDGSVKLLDFGVARLLGADGGDDGLPLTRGGQRAFTPEYASPEQIRGDAPTTTSDVYSLAVVLHELLTGRRPHEAPAGNVGALERAVLEAPLSRPGTLVTDEAARARGERDAARLRRRLSGDLDAILLKALRAEPENRYPSVESLTSDLRRHLDGLPVVAQRGWAGYRFRKFVGRNRGIVAATALVLLALAGGVVATSLQAKRARAAQARAERVSEFLAELLASVKPNMQGRDLPVSELLDAAAKRVGSELTGEPDVQGELETVIGQSDLSLGRYEEADKHLHAALRLRRVVDGPRSHRVVVALSNIGSLELARGELAAADSVTRSALALQRALVPKADTLTATLVDNLASIAHSQGRLDDAQRGHREALDLRMRLVGPRDDMVAFSMNNLAVSYGEQNRWAVAESLHRRAVGILLANHPEPSTLLADAENALATALDIQLKFAEAESLYRDVLARRAVLLGRDHPDYLFTEMNYAMFVVDRGRWAEGAALTNDILSHRGKTLPDSHPAVSTSLQTLGRCLDHLGRTAEGGRALEESMMLRRKYFGPDHWLAASGASVLGEHCALVKEFPRGEKLMLDADVVLSKAMGPTHPRTLANLKRLLALYEAWGRPDKAARIRARLAAAA
jgi:serine/threonine-protein kinase